MSTLIAYPNVWARIAQVKHYKPCSRPTQVLPTLNYIV